MSSRNRHSQELRELAVTQDTLPSKIQTLKIVVKKCLTMWALCNSLTRRYLPSNSHNNWLYAADATNKRLRNKIPSHIINVQSVSDDVSWQDKIGLHQFDNYLSQVQINIATVNNSCFLRCARYLASSSSFSWQCQDTLIAWGNQLSFL